MFAVGWPRVLASPAAGAGEAAVALEHDARADAVALVTRASVEVWNGGRHRTRAGGFARSPATVAEEGAYVAARWRDGGEVLAVAAEGGVVHLFDVAFFQDPPSAAPVPGATARRCRLVPRRVAIRLGGAPSASTTPRGGALSPVREEDEDEDAVPAGASRDGACVSLAGDARVLLVGTSTGRVARCDWDFGRGFLGGDAASSSSIPGDGVLGRTDRLANAGGALVDLDYAPALRVVVAVAASGACVASLFSFGRPSASAAAFSSDDRAADPRAPIRRRDPNAAGRDPNVVDASKCARAPGVANATRARLAPDARRVAVGASTGDATIFFLRVRRRVDAGSSASPLSLEPSRRVMTAGDLGYAPRDVGAVADVAWTRDGSAFAVGWARGGFAAWTPSGCRVTCALPPPGGAGGGEDPSSSDPSSSERADSALPDSGVSRILWIGRRGGAASLLVASATPERGVGGAEDEREAAAASSRLLGSARVASVVREVAFATLAPVRVAREEGDLSRGDSPIRHVFVASDAAFAARLGSRSRSRSRAGSRAGSGSRAAAAATRLPLPRAYVEPNAPLRFAVPDARGRRVLVAGTRGFCLHDARAPGGSRVFGDASQERAFRAVAAAWLEPEPDPDPPGGLPEARVAVACELVDEAFGTEEGDFSFYDAEESGGGGARRGVSSARGGWGFFDAWFGGGGSDGGGAAPRDDFGDASSDERRRAESSSRRFSLRVYPESHLAASSTLLETPIPAAPTAMSAARGRFLVLAFPPGADGRARVDVLDAGTPAANDESRAGRAGRGAATAKVRRRVALESEDEREREREGEGEGEGEDAFGRRAREGSRVIAAELFPNPGESAGRVPATLVVLRADGALSLADLGDDEEWEEGAGGGGCGGIVGSRRGSRRRRRRREGTPGGDARRGVLDRRRRGRPRSRSRVRGGRRVVAVDARRGRRSGVVRPPGRVTARRGRRPAALRAVARRRRRRRRPARARAATRGGF